MNLNVVFPLFLDIFTIIIIAEIIRRKPVSLFQMSLVAMPSFLFIALAQHFLPYFYILYYFFLFALFSPSENNKIELLNILSLSYFLFFFSKQLSYCLTAPYLFTSYYSIIIGSIFFSICIGISFFLRNYYTAVHIRSSDPYYKIITTIYVTITAAIFFYQFIFPEYSNAKIDIPPEISFLLLSSYGIFSLIIFALLYIHFKNKKLQKEQSLENEFLNQYLYDLEQYQKSIRGFKHDYKNILFSIENYINEEDLKGLKHFYYYELQETIALFDRNIHIQGLSNIIQKELHSLLLSKLSFMINHNIEFTFICDCEVRSISCKLISLIRALGIVIDNAIEEVSSSKKGKVSISIYQKDKNLHILILNDCREISEPLYRLKTCGFTTKNNGFGLGLYNLEKIKNEEKNLLIETFFDEHKFCQKFIILGVVND